MTATNMCSNFGGKWNIPPPPPLHSQSVVGDMIETTQATSQKRPWIRWQRVKHIRRISQTAQSFFVAGYYLKTNPHCQLFPAVEEAPQTPYEHQMVRQEDDISSVAILSLVISKLLPCVIQITHLCYLNYSPVLYKLLTCVI